MRRALDADKDSFAYKASHNIKDDYAQYKEWTDIVGQENMPKSLAEFQELKYNKRDEFEALKREHRTISEIKQKDWTPSFKEKTITEYYLYKKQGIEFTSHGIARFVQRQQKGITKEDIIEISKRDFDYFEEDNKRVKHWNGVVVVYTEATDEIVTVEKRNTVKSTWRKYDR